MTKSLSIPHIDNLNNRSIDSEVLCLLETKGARASIDCLNWPDKFPYHPLTVANIAISDTDIFIDFFVRSNYLRAVNYEVNSAVREDSSVSLIVRPDSESAVYSFDFNCIGNVRATLAMPGEESFYLPENGIAKIEIFASCGKNPFRELEGLFSWNVAAKIPFEIFGMKLQDLPEMIQTNLYKAALATSEPHFLSWNPIDAPFADFIDALHLGKFILEK